MASIYACTVEEVRSGDDLVLLVDLDIDDLYKRVRCRLQGVGTPDAYKASSDTEAGKVRAEVRRLTRDKCQAVVHSKNKSGWLIDLFISPEGHEVSLNQLLIARGYVFTPEAKAAA